MPLTAIFMEWPVGPGTRAIPQAIVGNAPSRRGPESSASMSVVCNLYSAPLASSITTKYPVDAARGRGGRGGEALFPRGRDAAVQTDDLRSRLVGGVGRIEGKFRSAGRTCSDSDHDLRKVVAERPGPGRELLRIGSACGYGRT